MPHLVYEMIILLSQPWAANRTCTHRPGGPQHPSEYLEGHHNCFLWTKVQQGLDTLDNPMRCAPMDGAGEILTKFSDGPLSERQHAQDCP